MKIWIVAATGAALLAGGVALAQQPPPGMEGMAPGSPEGGHHGPMGMERMMGHRPPPSKAAFFHLRKGDARVDIKCADDEPTKACIDAASALLDKLATQPK